MHTITDKEEYYVHHVQCIDSLNRAWVILQELNVIERSASIADAAFRCALIEYAKPYTRSDGIHKHGKNGYELPEPSLSLEDLVLHRQILTLRHKVLAHTDLTLKEAKVYVGSYKGRVSVVVSTNVLSPFPEIRAVIDMIERTLDNMYLERTRLEQALALTV